MAEERRRGGGDRRNPVPSRTGFTIYKTDGEPVDVPCPALVLYNFEQHFKTGVTRSAFAGEESSTRALWMAHEAERIATGNGIPFEEWIATVVAIDSWSEPLPLGHRASGTRSPL
jgi:hypothetical protein